MSPEGPCYCIRIRLYLTKIAKLRFGEQVSICDQFSIKRGTSGLSKLWKVAALKWENNILQKILLIKILLRIFWFWQEDGSPLYVQWKGTIAEKPTAFWSLAFTCVGARHPERSRGHRRWRFGGQVGPPLPSPCSSTLHTYRPLAPSIGCHWPDASSWPFPIIVSSLSPPLLSLSLPHWDSFSRGYSLCSPLSWRRDEEEGAKGWFGWLNFLRGRTDGVHGVRDPPPVSAFAPEVAVLSTGLLPWWSQEHQQHLLLAGEALPPSTYSLFSWLVQLGSSCLLQLLPCLISSTFSLWVADVELFGRRNLLLLGQWSALWFNFPESSYFIVLTRPPWVGGWGWGWGRWRDYSFSKWWCMKTGFQVSVFTHPGNYAAKKEKGKGKKEKFPQVITLNQASSHSQRSEALQLTSNELIWGKLEGLKRQR